MKIVRYENRTMYSETHGKIGIKDILKVIQSGETIKVICGKSKVDITVSILKKCLDYKTNILEDELYSLLKK